MSAPELAAWVPLRQLRSTVAEIVGQADTEAALATIMAAIDAGQVLVRWSAELAAWRFQQREAGRELQHPAGAQAGGLLAPPGYPPAPAFMLDLDQGIALAPGDPAGRKPMRTGLWPVGPAEIAWPQAAQVLAQAAHTARGAA